MTRFLLCSFALVLLYPSGIDMYLVGLPRIAQDLGASEAQLHIAFSVYLAGMASAMLFAGRIADRSGRKPVAIVGAAIFVIASLLCAQAHTSSHFLIGRFIQGIGAGSCYVVAFAILRDTLDDRRRAKVLSLLNGITCIIPVLAPVLGHLIMLKYPWQSLFYTMTGMGVMIAVLSVCIISSSSTNRILILFSDTKICTVFHSRELKKHKYRDYPAIVGVKDYQLLRYAIKDGGAYERLSDCNG